LNIDRESADGACVIISSISKLVIGTCVNYLDVTGKTGRLAGARRSFFFFVPAKD
jgi:hypothetical protein